MKNQTQITCAEAILLALFKENRKKLSAYLKELPINEYV